MYEGLIRFIREQYQGAEVIPLHAPVMGGREKLLVIECIDSTYVSSAAPRVSV